MKTALNVIPNLSVSNGWWIEGHIKRLDGRSSSGPVHERGDQRDHSREAASLCDKLAQAVVPLFYHDRHRFPDMMDCSIAINGSIFNNQRMVQECGFNTYFNR